MLSGYEARIGCQMTATVKALRVGPDVANQCGRRQQADTGNPGKTLTGVAVQVPSADLRFHHIDLAIDLPDMFEHVHQQLSEHARQSVCCVFGE